MNAAGQIIECSGVPPVLVGDGLGEAELNGLSQVVKCGRAGTDATVQETRLHKQIAVQSLAKSLFAAPSMFSRNIGTLAKDITMTPRMINMALCPGILQEGPSSRRIKNNVDARVKYLQLKFLEVMIWEATSDVDTPSGVPAGAVCFRLAPGSSTTFKDEPWITLCTCEKSKGRREYNIRHCPCFSSRASASATAPAYPATTADDDALTADAGNTSVLETPQDPTVAWGDALTLKVQLRDCNDKPTRKFACLPSTVPSGRMQDMLSSRMPNTHSTPDAAMRVMAVQPTGNVKRVSTVKYEGPDTNGTVVLTLQPTHIPSTGMLPVGSLARSKSRLTVYIYDGADWAELPNLNLLVSVIPGKPSMVESEMRLIQPGGSSMPSTSDEIGSPCMLPNSICRR